MPMSKDELEILNSLKDGFNNVNLFYNNTLSFQEFLKIQNTEEMNIYIYKTFIEDFINKLIKKYNLEELNNLVGKSLQKIKKNDSIRIDNFKSKIEKKNNIFEYIIIDFGVLF